MSAPVAAPDAHAGAALTAQQRKRLLLILGLAFLALWPHFGAIPESFRTTFLADAILAMSNAMIAASLVLLTGWVGQISLAQASFVGIGAFVTGLIVRGWHVPFPLSLPLAGGIAGGVAALLGLVALRVRGLYLAVATLIFAWMSDRYLFVQNWFVGAGGSSSIKARPIGREGTIPYFDFQSRRTFYYVMIAATAAVLIALANVRDSKTGRAFFAVRGSEIAAASLGINVMRTKLLAFAVSGFVAGAVGSLNMTHELVASASSFGLGRSLLYLAIAVVGGLGSLGGAVSAGILFASLQEVFFRVEALAGFLEVVSAMLLAAVLLFFPAGLAGVPPRLQPSVVRVWGRFRVSRRRLGPALSGGAARTSMSLARARLAVSSAASRARTAIRRNSIREVVRDLISRERRRVEPPASDETMQTGPVGDPVPAFTIRRAPWEVPDTLSRALERGADTAASAEGSVAAVQPASTAEEATPDRAALPARLQYVPGTATRPELPARDVRAPVLAARNVTVQFGGLVAVDDVSLEAREGEIVGLIGPNGAGKTTLFNAISGLNEPASGRVELFGEDITPLPVHERALLGIGRTFQVIQLFPQLTLFDNLLVATHGRNRSGFFSHMFATGRGALAERGVRERVRQVVSLLGLESVADRRVTGLPFGVLRMVEVARALVTGAPFVMLDEPASGLDNAETDRLSDLLFWVRQTLGVSLLLIEHDVRMVTGVTDYMYVLDRGRIIADGTPAEIQRNPTVIAAYLGEPEAPPPASATNVVGAVRHAAYSAR